MPPFSFSLTLIAEVVALLVGAGASRDSIPFEGMTKDEERGRTIHRLRDDLRMQAALRP